RGRGGGWGSEPLRRRPLGRRRRLPANRQLIAQPRSTVSRQRIAHLNDRENRHFRRRICRFCTLLSSSVGHPQVALLRRILLGPTKNGQENRLCSKEVDVLGSSSCLVKARDRV